jgi:ATP-dependent exoDNAse (exonuclease V) beta subunit
MACDADVVPLESRIEASDTQSDLEEVWQTERQLLYVAATRAREHLMLSGVMPVSEYFEDLI